MSVKYPSHLYIRIDRPLRADILAAAEAAGQNVSAFARCILRGSIPGRTGAGQPLGDAGRRSKQGGR